MRSRFSMVVLLALGACQSAAPALDARPEATQPESDQGGADDFYLGGARREALAEGLASAEPRATAATGEVPARDRLMIWRGTLGVAVARVDDSIERFLGDVQAWGGYLAQRVDTSVTCRVPAPRFDEAVAAVRRYGRVTHERIQAQDVTKEHLDLGIRLDNARRARDRLLALLEKATEVKDVLEIEGALRRLTEEIERMEGELKYLDDQVAMATLTVEFHAVASSIDRPRAEASRFGWINRVGVEHVRRGF